MNNLTPDEMMVALEGWLNQDPSRKAEVSKRLPQLAGLLA